MRIHTDKLDSLHLMAALKSEQAAGRIAGHLSFKRLTGHKSATHARAYEVQLEAAVRDNGRRAGNSGSYGAMRPEYDGYAATFDEWGWLLAALYKLDAGILVGTPRYPAYRDAENFHEKTGLTYAPEILLPLLDAGYWPTFVGSDDYTGGDPYPYVTGQAMRTKRGYLIGRRGANRSSDARYGKLSPRTPAEVREFAKMEEVSV